MLICNIRGVQDLGVLEENLVPFPMSGSTTLQDGTVLVIRFDWEHRNQIFRSVNKGITWTYLSTLPVDRQTTCSAKMYCTNTDTVFLADASMNYGGRIYRSTDKGLTWSVRLILGTNETIWSFFEDSHSRIYAGVYSVYTSSLGHAKLLRSIDDGLTWQVMANWPSYRHIHDVFVNKYNGYVYVAIGDYPAALMCSRDDGVTWTNIHPATLFTAINAKGDSNVIYLGLDGSAIYRFSDTGSSSVILEKIYDYGSQLGSYIFWMEKANGKLVFGSVAPETYSTAVLGVSDASWNNFYIVLEKKSQNDGWRGFKQGTRSYWNISKVFVQDDAQVYGGTAFQPSSEVVRQYELIVEVSGSGTTSPVPNTYHCDEGSKVSITALPYSGWMLNHWLLNSSVAGSANPYTVTMDSNYALTAVFTEITYLFKSGFETGDFSEWSGTYLTMGETATLVQTPLPHHGNYQAKFTTDGSAAGEYAYARKTFADQSFAYARIFFKITGSLPASGQNYEVMGFRNTNNGALAKCLVENSLPLRWRINYLKNGGFSNLISTTPTISLDTWYCIELYYKIDATHGEIAFYVNGNLIFSNSNFDSDDRGKINALDVGERLSSGQKAHSIYVDCVVIDTAYIGIEAQTSASTLNYVIAPTTSMKQKGTFVEGFIFGCFPVGIIAFACYFILSSIKRSLCSHHLRISRLAKCLRQVSTIAHLMPSSIKRPAN